MLLTPPRPTQEHSQPREPATAVSRSSAQGRTHPLRKYILLHAAPGLVQRGPPLLPSLVTACPHVFIRLWCCLNLQRRNAWDFVSCLATTAVSPLTIGVPSVVPMRTARTSGALLELADERMDGGVGGRESERWFRQATKPDAKRTRNTNSTASLTTSICVVHDARLVYAKLLHALSLSCQFAP